MSNYPYDGSKLKKFDVFAKRGKNGWAYHCSIEAKTEAQAKNIVLQESNDLKEHQLAIYPKR